MSRKIINIVFLFNLTKAVMISIQICSFFVNEQASKPFQDQRQKARKRVGEKDVCAPSLTRVGSGGARVPKLHGGSERKEELFFDFSDFLRPCVNGTKETTFGVTFSVTFETEAKKVDN